MNKLSEQKIPLTSAEIGCLWTSFNDDSMSMCVLEFMLKHLQDTDIKPAVQYAYDISSYHLDQLTSTFKQEQFAFPHAFSAEDVNMEAPWLFSDLFCLSYVNHMSKVGMIKYGGFITMSKRKDIRDFYTQALTEASTLYNQTTDIALSKGIHPTHPYIDVPKEADYVDSKKYYSGLNPFSKDRPLNAVEISHLYSNILTNSVGVKLCLSFAQTSPSKEIQDYMVRGKDISNKHIQIFTSTLQEGDVPTTRLPDLSVSDSTTPTFSDKLMMYHMTLLSTAGLGNYATAAAASQRNDLTLNYERLSLESAQFAKSGADIMIKHHWLEQPPGTKDKEHLVRKKDKY